MRKPCILHLVNNLRVTASVLDQVWAHDLSKYRIVLMSYLEKEIDRSIKLPKGVVTCAFGGTYGFKDIFRFKKYLEDNGVDIVHTHHTFSSAVARIAGRLADVKTVHEDGGGHQSYSMQSQALNTMTFWIGDAIVCVSNFVYDTFNPIEKLTVAKRKVNVIPYGVNLEHLKNRTYDRQAFYRDYGLDGSEFIISHTARLVPVKDEPYLLRLCAEVMRADNSVRLIIAGDGEMRAALEGLVKELGIEKKVIFTGIVPRDEIYRILHFSDLFAMTSDSEGMSVSLIEALASGVPAVLSDIPSFRETLAGSEAGVLINKKNALKENAKKVLDMMTSTSGKKEHALKLAYQTYDMKVCIGTYEALYDRLLVQNG